MAAAVPALPTESADDRAKRGRSSSPPRSAPSSSGTTSISPARWPRTSAANFFSGVQRRRRRFIFALFGLRRRLRGAPVRRAVVRPPGRPDRPQVHLPGHHDLIMGLATFVVGLLPGYATIGSLAPVALHRLPPAAGPGAGRRVWRCGDLRRRACAAAAGAASTRRWIQTTATRRPVPVAARHPGACASDDAGGVRRLGLAHPVPALDHPARRSRSGSACSSTKSPAFQQMKAEGKRSKAPLTRSLRPLGQRQDRAPRPARRHRRPGGGLVHGPVLRPVLPDPDAEARRHDGQHR